MTPKISYIEFPLEITNCWSCPLEGVEEGDPYCMLIGYREHARTRHIRKVRRLSDCRIKFRDVCDEEEMEEWEEKNNEIQSVNLYNQRIYDRRIAEGQITVGGLLKLLEPFQDSTLPIMFEDGTTPYNPHCYRGVYDDISISYTNQPMMTKTFISTLKEKGIGYHVAWKGGTYYMDEDSFMWKSKVGEAEGIAITGIEKLGLFITITTKPLDYGQICLEA